MKHKIAVIGDYNSTNKTHTAVGLSVEHSAKKGNKEIEVEWINTETAEREGERMFRNFSGIWSAPGSPFRSLEGSLKAVQFARENNIPHLGTCAGFQHSIIEFARNVLQIKEAQHEEYEPYSPVLFISKLECSLAGQRMKIFINKGTLAYKAYNSSETEEDYHCNFGINPRFKGQLMHPSLTISGVDQDKEIRIIEVPKHRFFVATLFVPQTNSTEQHPHPLVTRFVEECLK